MIQFRLNRIIITFSQKKRAKGMIFVPLYWEIG